MLGCGVGESIGTNQRSGVEIRIREAAAPAECIHSNGRQPFWKGHRGEAGAPVECKVSDGR